MMPCARIMLHLAMPYSALHVLCAIRGSIIIDPSHSSSCVCVCAGNACFNYTKLWLSSIINMWKDFYNVDDIDSKFVQGIKLVYNIK